MSDVFEKLKAPFPKSQVSWRAQTLTKNGDKALALAYIDARDVMERLDDVVGPGRWQNRYSHSDKKTICEIGILIADPSDEFPSLNPQWVWKSDGAGDSDVEAEKGALSDAFKRAAVRWGIGRYLYDLEATWVPCESYESNGKKKWNRFTDDPWNHVKKQPAPAVDPMEGQIKLLSSRLKGAKSVTEIDEIVKQQSIIVKKLAESAPARHTDLQSYIQERKNQLNQPSGESNE